MFGDPKVLLAQLVRDIQDNLDFTNSSSQGARPRVVTHETPILERFVFHQTGEWAEGQVRVQKNKHSWEFWYKHHLTNRYGKKIKN